METKRREENEKGNDKRGKGKQNQAKQSETNHCVEIRPLSLHSGIDAESITVHRASRPNTWLWQYVEHELFAPQQTP